jgi:hypothetical protein
MTLYLVTVEGYYDDYGSSSFSIGVFYSMDKAKEAGVNAAMKINRFYPELEDSVEAILDNYFDIMEFDLNTVYPVRKVDYDYSQRIRTDKYLGGYIE